MITSFELVSSLKTNLQKKSKLIPMVGTEYVDRAIGIFGCKVGKLPISYLGLPFRTLYLMASCTRLRDTRRSWPLGKKVLFRKTFPS